MLTISLLTSWVGYQQLAMLAASTMQWRECGLSSGVAHLSKEVRANSNLLLSSDLGLSAAGGSNCAKQCGINWGCLALPTVSYQHIDEQNSRENGKDHLESFVFIPLIHRPYVPPECLTNCPLGNLEGWTLHWKDSFVDYDLLIPTKVHFESNLI